MPKNTIKNIRNVINNLVITVFLLFFVTTLLNNLAIAANSSKHIEPSILDIINHFNLKPYPIKNSGYSNLIYKSDITLLNNQLPKGFAAKKYALFSSIYYLLPENGKLKFHATKATKQFHHYLGKPLLIFIIDPDGKLSKVILGKNIAKQEQLQLIIPANSYVAAQVYTTKNHYFYNKDLNVKYSMIGCNTIPSWEIEDCIRADYKSLIKKFPQHKKIIKQFT